MGDKQKVPSSGRQPARRIRSGPREWFALLTSLRAPASEQTAGPVDDGGWGSVRADGPNGYLFEGEMGQLSLLARRLRTATGRRGRAGAWVIRAFAAVIVLLLAVPVIAHAL